ncbi:MAG TPA: 4Fe-4S binding protein, partial [Candidatus Brocadiaceae bacterium]
MFTKFQKSFQTGIVTSSYPHKKETPPERFRGRIEIDNEKCKQCNVRPPQADESASGMTCVEVCPTGAYTWIPLVPKLQLGNEKRYLQLSHARCIFCGLCEEVCPYKAITIT